MRQYKEDRTQKIITATLKLGVHKSNAGNEKKHTKLICLMLNSKVLFIELKSLGLTIYVTIFYFGLTLPEVIVPFYFSPEAQSISFRKNCNPANLIHVSM